MLVLTRKSNESVIIANNIEVKILGVRGDQISLGFSAPRDISIHRKEVYDAIHAENVQAANTSEGDIERITDLFAIGFTESNNEGGDAGNETDQGVMNGGPRGLRAG